MTNLEIAEFLGTICKTIDQAIAFLEGDCGITGITQNVISNKKPNDPSSGVFLATMTPDTTQYFLKGTQIYEDTVYGLYAKTFIQNLMPLLTDEEKAKVLEVVQGMKERSKPAKASGGKGGGINIEVNPTITAQASASNYNYNDIKNLSELHTYISNSTAITNKAEIQNTLSALEDAKDGDSAESYVGLLLKLVELLSKDGILPPFVGKLAGGLGKWF